MQNYQVKLTKNVPRWLTLTTSLLLASNLAGCASFDLFGTSEKPITVLSVPVEKTPLAIALPDPLSVKPVNWIVITQDNQEAVFSKLKEKNVDPVLFGLSDDGYQQLSLTVAEMRNMLVQYRQIIVKYQEYYEPSKEEGKK